MSGNRVPRFVLHLQRINVDDIQYLERDLSFYELVSLGFLLFGYERTNAGFVLQKLLVAYQNHSRMAADLLRKYATINPKDWRTHIVEALTIIGARHVLRKLGFEWEELRQHFLPHVSELSVHIHPLLKALYKMCERLTSEQARHLVEQINEQHRQPSDNLSFSDYLYLEIFLLHWLAEKFISVGDMNLKGTDIQVLIEYLKLNELDELKELLVGTMRNNTGPPASSVPLLLEENVTSPDCPPQAAKDIPVASLPNISPKQITTNNGLLEPNECYVVKRETAGIVLIINQRDFYQETSEEHAHLLPSKLLQKRRGTDIDKVRLEEVFTSFGYTAETEDNLSHSDMLHRIRETVKRSFRFDSLIVCILSHGIDGAVYGCNSIPVEIAEIQQIVTADTLKKKPKLIIIQACQLEDESTKASSKIVKKLSSRTSITAEVFLDIILAMSTVPGYPAMRHTATGTWFIQSLCDTLNQLGDNKHMLDILVAVTRVVTQKRGASNEMMVPITTNTLRKYFFLPRREHATSTAICSSA